MNCTNGCWNGSGSFERWPLPFSEGPERDNHGQVGPVPLSQAHPVLVDKLRTSRPGQLWNRFSLKDIWVILRLDEWEGARLDEATRQLLLRTCSRIGCTNAPFNCSMVKRLGPCQSLSTRQHQHDTASSPQQTSTNHSGKPSVVSNCHRFSGWVEQKDHLLAFHRHCGDPVSRSPLPADGPERV